MNLVSRNLAGRLSLVAVGMTKRARIMMVAVIAGVYVATCIGLTLSQRALIYHPCHESAAVREAKARAHQFEPWYNATGEQIGWNRRSKTQPTAGQMLILHGNTGCALDWAHFADALQTIAAYDVFLLEYPGYGGRRGSLSQDRIFHAATESLALLDREQKVYLVGESLGTGVAAFLAGSFPKTVSGVLLIAPYNNMTAVAQYHLRIFPAGWMLRDKFQSDQYLQNYSGPVGFLLGGRDQVIPARFGRRLYDPYHGPKKLWIEPGATHDAVHQPKLAWWTEALEFLNSAWSYRSSTLSVRYD